MKRFLLLLLLFITGLASPVPADAAPERLIAVVMVSSQPRYQEIQKIFVENSGDFCGEGCRIYVQTPNVDMMSLRNSVRKAVALGAELIITYGPAATLAAKAEIPPVPILFADVYDPVQLELVDAKSLTGNDITGVRGDAPVQALFKYFTEVTGADSLAVFFDVSSPEGRLQKISLQESGKRKGVVITPIEMRTPDDHAALLHYLPADIDGLFLGSSEHASSQLKEVLALVATRRIPVITQRAGAAELGAFMVLETSVDEQGKKLAEMAGKVLSGSKVSALPMFIPHDVAFIINLKVAKQYGIDVPFQILSLASRVVR